MRDRLCVYDNEELKLTTYTYKHWGRDTHTYREWGWGGHGHVVLLTLFCLRLTLVRRRGGKRSEGG